jgi:hypothetical protein
LQFTTNAYAATRNWLSFFSRRNDTIEPTGREAKLISFNAKVLCLFALFEIL